jgi:hypothetical protein
VSRLRIHITSDLGAVDLQQPVPTSDAEPDSHTKVMQKK